MSHSGANSCVCLIAPGRGFGHSKEMKRGKMDDYSPAMLSEVIAMRHIGYTIVRDDYHAVARFLTW
jgi:hypothetical protein